MTATTGAPPKSLDIKLLHVKILHQKYHGTPQLCRAKALRARRKERENGSSNPEPPGNGRESPLMEGNA